jgi:hypothetical protein
MTKTQFRLGVVAIFAAILLYNITSPNRYTFVDTTTEGRLNATSPYRLVDGMTGKMWKMTKEGESIVWEVLVE